MPHQKLRLGTITATPGALLLAEKYADTPQGELRVVAELLNRHASGDWGTLDPEDAQANVQALDPGHPRRIMSTYYLDGEHHEPTDGGDRIWIITEYDRSVTNVMLPEDY